MPTVFRSAKLKIKIRSKLPRTVEANHFPIRAHVLCKFVQNLANINENDHRS